VMRKRSQIPGKGGETCKGKAEGLKELAGPSRWTRLEWGKAFKRQVWNRRGGSRGVKEILCVGVYRKGGLGDRGGALSSNEGRNPEG